MKVVLTAPMPGRRTPSLPFGGATFAGLRMRLFPLSAFVTREAAAGYQRRQRQKAKRIMMREARAICKSEYAMGNRQPRSARQRPRQPASIL
jgi:hypothetical protein